MLAIGFIMDAEVKSPLVANLHLGGVNAKSIMTDLTSALTAAHVPKVPCDACRRMGKVCGTWLLLVDNAAPHTVRFVFFVCFVSCGLLS